MTFFIYSSILLRWKLIKIEIINIKCIIINRYIIILFYLINLIQELIIKYYIILILYNNKIKNIIIIFYILYYILIIFISLTADYLNYYSLYFYIINDYNSLSLYEDIFWNNELVTNNLIINNNFNIDFINNISSEDNSSKSLLSNNYLRGESGSNNPTPSNNNDINIIGTSSLNESNNNTNSDNSNNNLNYENNKNNNKILNNNSNNKIENNNTVNTVTNNEIKIFNNNSVRRSDFVYGWSLYDEPGNIAYMPIYFTSDLKQGFITDNGDFFIPTNAYGKFSEHLVYKDINGNIIPDRFTKVNFRPNPFKGIVYGPPSSHKTSPN